MSQAENFVFHPDINQLISFNSNNYKYPKKRTFLDQLINFAKNALDKIRLESLTDKRKLNALPELFIRVIPDKTNNTLTIVDSGIGMTKDVLVKKLGTDEWSAPDDVRLYWAYLVAKKVIVTTKHNDDEQYVWESQTDVSFTVTRDTSGENLGRGTKITLFLKEDQLEYLEERRLKRMIMKYSKLLRYPIYLWVEKEISNDEDEVSHEWYLVNEREINFMEQFAFKHFFVESPLKIKAALFVRKKEPFETKKKSSNISAYVHGDLIMANCKELIPGYLGFVKGSVDLQDPPFNIYRKMFQWNNILKVIREILVEKCFELFYEIAEVKEDYNKFYEAFSWYLKLGILQDPTNKIKIAELLRYHSTMSGDEMTSLKDYVTMMKGGQNEIFYITGESKEGIENSPFLEKFKKKGYEVLFMVSVLDIYAVNELKEFEGKKFVSATKEGLKLEDEKEKKDELKKKLDGLCEVMKDVLLYKVDDVVVSDCFIHSPCCLETEYGVLDKKIMKINPENPMVKRLMILVDADKNNKYVKELVSILFNIALFTSHLEGDGDQGSSSRSPTSQRPKDGLRGLGGPMTRLRAKKAKEDLDKEDNHFFLTQAHSRRRSTQYGPNDPSG